jgi:uncharacterized protein
VKDPREVVKTGDIVKVKVMSVDVKRKRIALSMRLDDSAADGESTEKSGDKPGYNKSGAARHSNKKQVPVKTEPKPEGAFAAAFAAAKLKK